MEKIEDTKATDVEDARVIKKKPHTSNEVIKRYKDKTYKTYTANLRKVDDYDIIKFLEAEKKIGINPTDVIRKFVRGEYV